MSRAVVTKCLNHCRSSSPVKHTTEVRHLGTGSPVGPCKDVVKAPRCPLKCVLNRPPKPPCVTPEQQPRKGHCDRLCMPCCDKITIPFNCDVLDVRLNTCKKEEYWLPSYSECQKAFDRKLERKLECCHWSPTCRIREISEMELKTHIPIRDRQARILGRDRY